jgi:phosphate transport system protein
MASLIKEMMHGALDAFARVSIENITEITGKDENVNREYENVIRRLITRMMEDPRNITRALDVIWAARAMERIGDYACNISEHLIYMVNGQDVRHLSQQELEEKIKGFN